MMRNLRSKVLSGAIAGTVSLLAAGPSDSLAAVSTGPGGSGVTVGSSALIASNGLDYSDTFTLTANGGEPGRTPNTFPVPAEGLVVENTYGNPSQSWPGSRWSISNDANATPGSVPFPGGTNAGTATGMTQTGGGFDAAINYDLRDEFVLQFDANQANDRVNAFTGSTGTIFGGMSIFFRTQGHALPDIGIFNGSTEFETGLSSGIPAANQFHNYAVRFSPTEVEVFVDEVSRGVIDLTTFNGGSFLGYSNAFVGYGSTAAGNRTWTDNFQVGAPIPEPAALSLLGLAGLGLLARRRRGA